MNPSGVLAIDVGGTSVKAAVVDATGAVVRERSVGTPSDPEESVQVVLAMAAALRDDAHDAGIDPLAMGVVVPGEVDEQAGVARYSANLGWRDVPLRARLTDTVDVPVAVGHDVTSAGIAELTFGGHGDDDAVVLQLGTGVAATIRSGGRIVGGARQLAGEIGHVAIVPDGEACPCGQRGCLERYASAASILRRYRDAGGDADPALTTEQLAARLDTDPTARRVWDEAADALAAGIATITMLLDPQLVVLSGGLSAAGALLLDPTAGALSHKVIWRPAPTLALSDLGGRVGLAGAALLAWRSTGRETDARWAR